MLESLLTVKNEPGKITSAMVECVNVPMYDHKQDKITDDSDDNILE